MNIITKPRGCGKTYDLIITSATTRYPIVTGNRVMAQHIIEQAKDMGYDIPEPVDIKSYLEHKRDSCCDWSDILIDEVDLVLNELLNSYVVAATHSQPYMK